MSHLRALFIGLVLALAASYSNAAWAADDERLQALERKLDASLQTIDQLAARVRELETQLARDKPLPQVSAATPATAATATPAAADEADRLTKVESDLAQMTAASSAATSADKGLAMHGFIDVGIGNNNVYDPVRHGATVGAVDFYLSPQLGERVKGLVEMNVEVAHGDGQVGIDLERTQLGYQFSEAATLWLGRFHTPYGYYNTAFHHGLQISTALRRPRFLAFEDQGGILPAHTTGLWLTGEARDGDARVRYDLFVGNGHHIIDGTLDPQAAGSFDGQVVVGGRLGLKPGGALSDLQVGVSYLSGRVTSDLSATPGSTPASTVNAMVRLNVAGLYAYYDSDRWEHQAEYYLFRNENLDGAFAGTHRSSAGFVQFGYRSGLYTPYVRYEHTVLDQTDNYFLSQTYGGSYYREAIGLRYDLNLKSALKVELAETHNTDSHGTVLNPRIPSFSDVLGQIAVRF